MKNVCENNPLSSISVIFNDAVQQNTSFLKHYIKLDETFSTPDECYNHYVNAHKTQVRLKIDQDHANDINSINPALKSPLFCNEICCHEYDRTIITRYRTGCHKLKIQTGRIGGDDRDTRLCSCGVDVQTIAHVLFQCPLTTNIRQAHGLQNESLETFFNGNDCTRMASILKAIEKLI